MAQNSWARVPASRRERLRQLVFERDGWRCQIRGPRCTGAAEDLDHIVPREHGGALLDPGNCRAACRKCNRGRRRFVPSFESGSASREW